MKKFLPLGVAILLGHGLGAAAGADLARGVYTKAPPPVAAPLYDWSGFYLGINGGWGTSNKCWTLVGFGGAPVGPIPDGCPNPSGGMVGGQLGYSLQLGTWVFGLDAQGDWADLRGSVQPAAFPGTTNRAQIDSLGLFTGRVGYAMGAAMIYARGGAALVHDKYNYGLTGAPIPIATASESRWGATVGGGLEYGFAPGWSVAADYQHAFLGRRDVNFSDTVVENIRQDLDMFTARLNYRFGGPIAPRY